MASVVSMHISEEKHYFFDQCQREDLESSWVSPALWEFLYLSTWSNISGHFLGCYHNSEVLASRNEEAEKLHSKQSFTQSRVLQRSSNPNYGSGSTGLTQYMTQNLKGYLPD